MGPIKSKCVLRKGSLIKYLITKLFLLFFLSRRQNNLSFTIWNLPFVSHQACCSATLTDACCNMQSEIPVYSWDSTGFHSFLNKEDGVIRLFQCVFIDSTMDQLCFSFFCYLYMQYVSLWLISNCNKMSTLILYRIDLII